MISFANFWQQTVNVVWGIPLVMLIGGTSLYFAATSRLLPFTGLRHAYDCLRGHYSKPDDPGEIPHFQALSSALSGTIGMGNIAGVAIAISMGGPGAVFWMWIAGLLGMITKFFTCTLACLYRYKDEDGIAQGGPMYFIELGLGKRFKPLAIMFAVCGMFGCLPMFQSNQLAGLLTAEFDIEPTITGITAALIVGIIIMGDIRRIGQITSRLVPAMFMLYVISSLLVIIANYSAVPSLLADIFNSAFGGQAVLGGAMGLTFKEVLIVGVKRAVFSNEAGVGTEAMAHGAARTNEPVREGLVAMLGPLIDTHIVCTLTALVILSTGVSTENSGVVMTANAFGQVMPHAGKLLLLMIFAMFAITTMITYSYYSLKCARYLFGKRNGNHYIYIYLLLIPVAANWSQAVVVNIIDTMFALMVIPTLTATVLLSPKVIKEMQRYFRNNLS